jgi:hypothetical protein
MAFLPWERLTGDRFEVKIDAWHGAFSQSVIEGVNEANE